MCNNDHWNRPVGFRWAPWDLAIIVAGAAGTWASCRVAEPLAWFLATVVAHFLVFCNLLRVRRSLELTWAGLFLLNTALWATLGELDGMSVLVTQLPVTVIVAAIEICSPCYHGIFANKGRDDP